MAVKVEMRLAVALHVHGHEGHELHEAGIDAASAPGIARRHAADEVSSNQLIGLLDASSFTLVGLTRVSTGPAMSVMLFGFAGSCACAMTATAATARTVGIRPTNGRPARARAATE